VTDEEIRFRIFDSALTTGRVPQREEIGCAQADLQRLADAHVVVLDEHGAIRMAMPWSAVPTPFPVHSGEYSAFGNCIWDALGILAMKHADGVVESACACCGEAMPVHIRDSELQEHVGVIHFGVPARRWWDDIVFT
jgi:alkylmercury lyase-like protein